jgi:hypothetical protein
MLSLLLKTNTFLAPVFPWELLIFLNERPKIDSLIKTGTLQKFGHRKKTGVVVVRRCSSERSERFGVVDHLHMQGWNICQKRDERADTYLRNVPKCATRQE